MFDNTSVDRIYVTQKYQDNEFCGIQVAFLASPSNVLTQSSTLSSWFTRTLILTKTNTKLITKSVSYNHYTYSYITYSHRTYSPNTPVIITLTPKPINKSITLSISLSLMHTRVRTVSFSYTQTETKTYLIIFNSNDETYQYSLTETIILRNLPFIIYSLSPTYFEFEFQFLVKKKGITQEKLIGIVCGSTAIFFIIVSIVIFIYKKNKESNYMVYEPSISSDESEDKNIEVVTININYEENNNTEAEWL